MNSFIGILAVVLLGLVVGYYIGVNVTLNNPDIIRDVMGHSFENELPEPKPPTFQYCKKTDIKEAFKVSDGLLPTWAFSKNTDVMIWPKYKVTIHKDNGYNVVASQDDYLIKDNDNDFYSCPAEIFESTYQKIETN